jgi:ubiquinone/menaquinone biosynthesis C-methylase UbiE
MLSKRNEIIVDLSNLKLNGKVLDMGYEGKGIIYRLLKNTVSSEEDDEAAITLDTSIKRDDCNWVYGNPVDMPFGNCSYDTVTVFFSFSYIRKKHIGKKVIEEISRILNECGKLYLWDINIKLSDILLRRKVLVMFPDNTSVSYGINKFSFGRRFNISFIIPFIERYFTINKAEDSGNYFYIEAVKKTELAEKKDDNF